MPRSSLAAAGPMATTERTPRGREAHLRAGGASMDIPLLRNSADSLTVGAASCRDFTAVRNACRGINPLPQPSFYLAVPKFAWVFGLVTGGTANREFRPRPAYGAS